MQTVADSDTDDDEPVIRVTHGYSRDHRPDLKQVVTRFICENQAGIPVFMKSLSGNSRGETLVCRHCMASHGLITFSPAAWNGATSRVATVKPRAFAMAAM